MPAPDYQLAPPPTTVDGLRSARVISTGHAFVQSLRHGHYELGVDIDRRHRLTVIFVAI